LFLARSNCVMLQIILIEMVEVVVFLVFGGGGGGGGGMELVY